MPRRNRKVRHRNTSRGAQRAKGDRKPRRQQERKHYPRSPNDPIRPVL